MANFFTRALDKITPWRRGGEVQRDQQARNKKKRREDPTDNSGLSVDVARPNQNIVVGDQEQQRIQAQRPENLFAGLNNNLRIGQPKPPTIVQPNTAPTPVVQPQPQPGQVIRPTLSVTAPVNNQRILVNGKPVEDTNENKVNRGLDRGQSWEEIARGNNLDLKGVKEYSQATRPDYGIKVARPKQGVGNRIRDIFDTNTESDKFRRQEGNKVALSEGRSNEVKPLTLERSGNIVSRTPIVGHVTKTLNTLGAQGAELIPTIGNQFATRESSAATEEYTKAVKSGDKKRIAEAKQRMSDAIDRVDDYNRQQDAAHTMFAKNDGGLFNSGTLYDDDASQRGDVATGLKDVVAPTAVSMLDLYTLGRGSAIEQAIKEGGLRTGVRVAAPNIVKATAGNYASGDINARAEGASNAEAMKSGLINSIFGLVPDVGLPALTKGFKNRVLPKIMRGKGVNPTDVIDELDDAGISASAEAANQALRPTPIRVQQPQDIPVKIEGGFSEPVPVRTPPRVQPNLIKELSGDFNFPSFEKLEQIRTADASRAATDFNAAARPDARIEGVTPRTTEPFKLDSNAVIKSQEEAVESYAEFLRSVGEGNGTQLVPNGEGGYFRSSNNVRFGDTAGKRMTKAAWREEAERQLASGKADPAIQKMYDEAADPEVQSMLTRGEQPDVPEGRPIQVKQVNGIPVTDQTVVPTNLPETPGQVRATTTAAPMEAKSEAVANAPVVATPTRLPAEVQNVLDNPKQFNKRQVAAARNQRKLARQAAKANEDTAEAIGRIESTKASTTPQGEGFAPTGQFARGKRGNVIEKASAEAEAAAGRSEMADRSVDDLLEEIGTKETFSPGDRRRIGAALENITKANPDDTETRFILKKLQAKSRSESGAALALIPKVIRKSSTADTLVNRWESKIARALDDPTKMTDEAFATVQRANENFTLARDKAANLEEQFKRTGSESDFKAWEEAHSAARKADEDAKFTEVAVAKKVLKGEKGAHAGKVIDDLKKQSSVNTMDLVTANMLSGTATGFRNTFGTELAGVENRLFANTRAKITNALFDENVGGFNRKGARMGRKVGIVKLGRDASRRAAIGGKNPLEWAKNWATTINSGGESSLQSQVYSRLGKYYQNEFKAKGLSGKELDMRMRHAMITDPDAMGEIYLDSAMKSSGLTGLFDKGQTIEKAVTDYIGKQTDSKVLQGGSKLLMRLAVGFPTATGNFMYQSAKRLTVGIPSYLEMGVKLAKGDKLGAAQAFERGMKETGSGLATLGLGVALGSQGMISGPYPDDPEERARWEREGISENAIKIGGAWFPIPQGAGMLGLPILTGAAIGRDGGEGLKEMYNPGNLSKLLPTDQIQGFLNMASGDGAPQDFKNFVASGVRASTPAGALFNQISKSFDDTKNDTTTKDLWSNIIDQVASGIPGVNNAMNIPSKEDDAGNVIQNPNPLQLAFGATSATQGAGEERTAQITSEVNKDVKRLSDTGAFGDPNIAKILDDDEMKIYNDLGAGKEISPDDLKKLKEAMVKGVSQTGDDTAYLEREEYDSNLAALKLKKQLMEDDAATKPSDIKKVDTAIKRGQIYKDGKIPYDMIDAYQQTGVDEWRKMGDPESDDYDPDMYQQLWALDERMTKSGVSYKKGALDKPKYAAKVAKGKGGGAGSKNTGPNITGDFGQLKAGQFAPNLRAYETIDQQTGSVPIIRRVRPNIVHKISSSG